MFATRRRWGDAGRRISLIAVATGLALAATFIGSLLVLGVALYDRSVADSRNMAVALQQYALRTVTTAELSADTVRDKLLMRGGLAGIEGDRAMHQVLKDLSARLPDGSGIIIVDPAGRVVANYAEFPARPVDLSDRRWFLAHRDEGTNFLISDALLSRVTNRKMFVMTLAVRRGEGGLMAIVNLGVPSDALIGAEALPQDRTGVVLTLLKRDGGLLARSDFPDDLLGMNLGPVTSGADAVTVLRSRPVDGRMAVEATETEPLYGLVARASIPLMQVFRPLFALSAIGLPLLIAMILATNALGRSLAGQHRRLEQTTARLQVVLDASHLGTWHLDVRSGASEMNERWAQIVGHTAGEITNSSQEWVRRLHPDEKDHVLQALSDMLEDRAPLMHLEHRLRHKDGHWVWVLDSGCVVERDEAGKPLVATGTLLDISERRETEKRLRILMGEVDHRSKNLLAVVHSLINLMPPDELPRFKATLLGRVKALGHVHTLLSEAGWSGVKLAKLVATETAPYRSGPPPLIVASGPPVTLHAAAAQAFAMVLHELMTNSAKYGALSAPTGRVAILWAVPSDPALPLVLTWSETGGPPVVAPTRDGFGSKLLVTLVVDQLGGTIDTAWQEAGAVITITVPMAAIVPQPQATSFDLSATAS